MFLKSLEIRGFKSFADKTELNFKQGITAVVGPNGSGKSNIADAVKWVLGEQSVKNLRGGKMQDVIFAGTQYRKPVGLAQVTLVLDNTDGELPIEYNDVTITRRIFRSGESEYYLNNTKCRLKDIQELFMDTGIGKEGYSIIGQGKIEAVLSGKPEERRSLLEEAAGIVKFKTRKEEAEKKLQKTDENIQRINDIFSTYEERIEPLREEKEKAEKFLDLSQVLKTKEVTLILHNLDDIEGKIKKLKDDISKDDVIIKQLYNKKESIKNKLNTLNNDLELFDIESNEERKRYYSNKELAQSLNSEVEIFKERIKNFEESIVKTSQTIFQLQEKFGIEKADREKQKEELKNLKEENLFIEKSILEIDNSVKESNEKFEKENSELKEAKDYQVQLISEITQYKNELLMLENDFASLKTKLNECKDVSNAYMNSIKVNYTTKESLSKKIITFESKINEHEEKIKEYKRNISIQIRSLNSNNEKLKVSINKYNKLEANYNALVNLEKQYEGYAKSVKNLMQSISKGKNSYDKSKICVLGEIVKVPKKFENAIEISLGGSISNVITDNEVLAKELISHLKINKLGRVTFLPLNIIKPKKNNISEKIRRIRGYVGVASELIDYENKYKNAIEYVLGKTVVAENMDSALIIAKEAGYTFKIVTLDGEVVNVGGALTGGSVYHKNTSIISRKREIEDIAVEIRQTDKIIKEVTNVINEQKNSIKVMDDTCLNLKDEIYCENIEKTKVVEKINAIDKETEKLKRDLQVSTNEVSIIEETIKNSNKELENKKIDIKELLNIEEENKNKILILEENLNEYKEFIREKSEIVTSFKIKKAKLSENISNISVNIEKADKVIEELENEIIILNNEVNNWNENIKYTINKIKDNEVKINELEEFMKDSKEKFKENEVKRIKLKEEIKFATESLENVTIDYNKNERLKNNTELSLTRYDVEKENLYSKLNDEMKLSYAEALEFKLENINIDECKKDIILYKNHISNLGVVNLGAIQEYTQLMEKYNFMSAQKEDLIKAKEELESVVFDMTDKMKVVFKENFEKLRKNFNETFKALFKGGNADLILEDGDELNSNIQINVQPPGKKLQNINLMSGGEKGLSAIALLFAILKMKPTPFCILDEIEAALDDFNVTRYAEFLKRFSNNTQFIIITHRKGSMEASDILYGVTMEEKGISKIVSVDLNK